MIKTDIQIYVLYNLQADERKRRTLAAYDAIARSGVAGPKIVVREELEQMERKYPPFI